MSQNIPATNAESSFSIADYDGTIIETMQGDGLDGRVVNTLQVKFFDVYDTEEKFSKQFKFWNDIPDGKLRLLVLKQNAKPKTIIPPYEGQPGHCLCAQQMANGDVCFYDSGNWFSDPDGIRQVPDLVNEIKNLAGPNGRCYRMDFLTIQHNSNSCAIYALWYVILLYFGEEPYKYDLNPEGMYDFMTLLSKCSLSQDGAKKKFKPTKDIPLKKEEVVKMITKAKIVFKEVHLD